MIYSRWGCPLRLTADCGDHQIKGYKYPVAIVKAIREDDGAELYYFTFPLRADGGSKEIDEALKAVPKVVLDKVALRAAIKEAS